ncbi:MAG: MbnP family protein [Bacteroidia bacterium]
MKFSNLLLPAFFTVLLFSFSSCKKQGCTDPLASNYNSDAGEDDGSCEYYHQTDLSLHLYPMAGNEALVYNQEYSVNGRKLKFTRAQFYISGIRLRKADNSTAAPAMPYILFQALATEYNNGMVDTGHYSFLDLSVGVDSASNHGDPALWGTTHPLYIGGEYSTYWTWSQGYVFMRLEGYVDSSPAGNGNADAGFAYHVGNDEFLRTVSIAINKNLQGQASVIELNVDFAKMLEDVDFTTELETHSTNNKPLAEKIANKAPEAITLRP